MDPQKWDEVFAINVSAAMVTIKSVIPFLSHRSSITVIASMNSWRGDKNLPSYVASKHAVLGLVRSAALELGPSGVRVNAVGPGPVATPALVERIRRREGENNVDEALESLGAQTALRKLVTAGEVAQAVIFLGSDFSSGITGQLLNVDGGMN
jgi:NAD(P)-dependent dehydrogenase (short-subunit alcohol dehydrogenase family)